MLLTQKRLKLLEIKIHKKDNKKIIKIFGQKELFPKNIDVPNDLSSSAFFIVSALINKNSHIILKNINNLDFLNVYGSKNWSKFSRLQTFFFSKNIFEIMLLWVINLSIPTNSF